MKKSSSNSLFIGGSRELFPGRCDDFLAYHPISAARVMHSDEGFIHDDCLLVRAEIRLKLQDNERWRVSVTRKTATCTVRSTSPSKYIDLISIVETKGAARNVPVNTEIRGV